MFSLENVSGTFSFYVCLSKVRENTWQYDCLSDYYRRKTYSSENVRECKLYFVSAVSQCYYRSLGL